MVTKPNLGIGPDPLWLIRQLDEPGAEPEYDFVPLGPQAAAHIEGQREAIEALAKILEHVVRAIDFDRPETARRVAVEALDELRHCLTRH